MLEGVIKLCARPRGSSARFASAKNVKEVFTRNALLTERQMIQHTPCGFFILFRVMGINAGSIMLQLVSCGFPQKNFLKNVIHILGRQAALPPFPVTVQFFSKHLEEKGNRRTREIEHSGMTVGSQATCTF